MSVAKKDYKKIHIIGNPPFGRQSSSAIKFIKKWVFRQSEYNVVYNKKCIIINENEVLL